MTDAAALRASDSLTYQAPAAAAQAPAAAAPSGGGGGLTFHELLSDLNPLQYLPVVGTIYRAVTGDVIPKPLREAGSLVVSGLLSGPVGLAIGAGTLAFEKLTGIDFEDLEQSVMASLSGASPQADASQATASNVAAPSPATEPPAHAGAWTATQLAAYGVVTLRDGTLRQGDLAGSDVLNALQLGQVAPATAVA